jgi:hypothetical protein
MRRHPQFVMTSSLGADLKTELLTLVPPLDLFKTDRRSAPAGVLVAAPSFVPFFASLSSWFVRGPVEFLQSFSVQISPSPPQPAPVTKTAGASPPPAQNNSASIPLPSYSPRIPAIGGVSKQYVDQNIAVLRAFISENRLVEVVTRNSGGSGITSVDASGGVTGLSFGGGPVTGSGTLTLDGVLNLASGGTGTSSIPIANRLLLSDSNGSWEYVATSSLNITAGTAAWGSIMGTLANQTDLQTALNALLPLSSWYATTTDGLAEGSSHPYWTNARFDTRLSATTSLPAITTLANLGTISTSLTGFVKATAGVLSTAAVDLAADVAGILPVANGGTGWASIAANAVLLGNGTNKIATTSAGANGQVLALVNGVPTWTATTSVQNLSFTYPIQNSGNTVSLAFGTTTSNTWASTQTFTNSPILGLLSGLVYGNSGTLATVATSTITAGNEFSYSGTLGTLVGGASGTLSLAANGVALTKLAQIAANSILGNNTGATGNVVAFATSTLGIAISDTSGTLAISRGGTGTTTAPAGQIIYGGGGSTYQSVATTTVTCAGSNTCTQFFIIGSSPITITGTGLTIYDAWTHAFVGQSATTSAVGIGTTTPFSQFSVSSSTAGNANTSLLAVASSSNATFFNVLGSGNVGIGSTSPGTLFSIQGSANFTSGTSTILGNGFLAPRFNATATSTFAGVQIGTGGLSIG